LADRIKTNELMGGLRWKVETVRQVGLTWFGHVLRKNDDVIVKQIYNF